MSLYLGCIQVCHPPKVALNDEHMAVVSCIPASAFMKVNDHVCTRRAQIFVINQKKYGYE